MIGGIYVWKDGTEYAGEHEICVDANDTELKFESGHTVFRSELRQSLDKVGDHRGVNDLPTDPLWMLDPNASVDGAIVNPAPIVPEKTLIDQLLDRQKKWDSDATQIDIKIPILTKKVFELAAMMFDEKEIIEAIVKRARAEVQETISTSIENLMSSLTEKLESHYGKSE